MKKRYDNDALLKSAALVTVACLIPCAAGELLALLIGVSLQLCTCFTIIISFFIVYLAAILMAARNSLLTGVLQDNQSLLVDNSDRAVTITVILIVMNYCVYHLQISCIASIMSLSFFIGFPVAILVAFLAAVPVSFWMIVQDLDSRN